MWERVGRHLAHYVKALEQLMDGYPVGAVKEVLSKRFTVLASDLLFDLASVDAGAPPNVRRLATSWTALTDASSLVILGDPAVRLQVASPGEVVTEHPIDIVTAQLTEHPLSATQVPETQIDHASPGTNEITYYFNGINGDTGDYLTPPKTIEELSDLVQGREIMTDRLKEL